MLLKPKDVAKLLNISVRTVHRQTEAGHFKAVMVGSHRRYNIDQFASILDVEKLKRQIDLLQNPPPAASEDAAASDADFLGQ